MKEAARRQASITGSLILVLLSRLDKEDRHKASVIRLEQRIRKILRCQPSSDGKLGDKAYDAVKAMHVDDNIEIDIAMIVEALAFNKEEYMKQLFGKDILSFIERAASKVTVPDMTKQQGKDSYMFADELKKSLEKVVFESMQA
jgi:hypothetical protein